MMRKLIVIGSLLTFLSGASFAQNLQLHYNLRKADDGVVNDKSGFFTSTIEMYKKDSLGYTFFFVDMVYTGPKGMSFAYGEIVRGFNIPKVNFMKFEVSYNGGINYVNNVWLAGPAFPLSFKNGFATMSAYFRQEKNQNKPNAQMTGVWTLFLVKGKVKFNGFFDVWSRDQYEASGKTLTFLSEPQVWYNINDHFAFGGEVEISKNFYSFTTDVVAMPTTAIKWTF